MAAEAFYLNTPTDPLYEKKLTGTLFHNARYLILKTAASCVFQVKGSATYVDSGYVLVNPSFLIMHHFYLP